MTEQPELRWAPMQPAPKRAGRVWLIVILAILALAIVAALLFVLIPRGADPKPTMSPSSSASPTPTASITPTTTPTPTPSPVVTSPPAVDPSVATFRAQVRGWLSDASRGLDIVAGASGQDALPVIDSLQQDAQRLSDAQAPSSINQKWRDGVGAYSQKLTELRSAVSAGSVVAQAVEAARSAAGNLKALVGL